MPKVGDGRWQSIGTDDTAPYRVYHDVSGLEQAPHLHTARWFSTTPDYRPSAAGRAVPPPLVTIEAPAEGSNVRGTVEAGGRRPGAGLRGTSSGASPGAWTPIGTDDSSPVYTVFDDLTRLSLTPGTQIQYRAVLQRRHHGHQRVRMYGAGQLADVATLYYHRPAGDYGDQGHGWGLHMWGNAVDPAVLAQIAWDNPWPWTRSEGDWAATRSRWWTTPSR